MGIDRWPHRILLDLFLAGLKRLNMQIAQKRPFLYVLWLLVRGVKIQKPKTRWELIACPMGFVWTYF